VITRLQRRRVILSEGSVGRHSPRQLWERQRLDRSDPRSAPV